ncbi:hypothetical protein A2U01_0100373, partial [Trifolium medium]|nr:hypothetical protein [Trifolium medium]
MSRMFMDDRLAHSKADEEYVEHLRSVLKTCQKDVVCKVVEV